MIWFLLEGLYLEKPARGREANTGLFHAYVGYREKTKQFICKIKKNKPWVCH